MTAHPVTPPGDAHSVASAADVQADAERGSLGVDAFIDRLVYPLVVVTVEAPDGERSGCLAGFFTQCSIEPTRFVVCISKVNHTFDIVERSTRMGLHLLGEDQDATATLFGEETGDRTDKFARTAWHHGPWRVPILDGCAAWMVVDIAGRVDAGDHVALVTDPCAGGSGAHAGVLTNRNAPPLQPGHPVD